MALLLTNAVRREVLLRTVTSANACLPVDVKIIALDSRSAATLAWVSKKCPEWQVVPIRHRAPLEVAVVGKRKGLVRIRRKGYRAAVAGAIRIASQTHVPWLFWLEDDFEFNEPVPLEVMRDVLIAHPHVAQMGLVRQPWYPYEIAAGSILNIEPDAYTQRDGWLEHRRWWTMNPMLCRTSLFKRFPWPVGPESEFKFGALIRSDPNATLGLWGYREDWPMVRHIGVHRAGRSY